MTDPKHNTKNWYWYLWDKGNTGPYPMSQGKNWCFTYNNYTSEKLEEMKGWKDLVYVFACHEIAPTTGTPHAQGWAQFSKNKRRAALHKLNNKISWRLCKGDDEDQERYCRKECGQILLEHGEYTSFER